MNYQFKFLASAALLAAALWATTSCTQQPVTSIESLADWEYSADSASWEAVQVPHSWNATDGRTAQYRRGKGYYRRTLQCTADEAQRPTDLLLEGAAQQATVYVNGAPVVHHKGGYTPFWVELTGYLHEGSNELVVVCDNSLDLTLAPVDSDFNKNGGLHNPVSLYRMSPHHFSTHGYGMHRLHVSTPQVSDESAYVKFELAVENASDRELHGWVDLSLLDQEGNVCQTLGYEVVLGPGEELPVADSLALLSPHRWDGIQDPYLYTAKAALRVGKVVVDEVSTHFGVRTFAMDREQGFTLNGHPYPLRGVSIHQDLEGHATAMSRADYERDYQIVTELGCNFVRLAHYPHCTWALDLCDSLGLIVQTEIPWVNVCGVNARPEYFDNLADQMTEMVQSHYNHPAIMFWGIFNEVAAWGNRDNLQGPIDYDKVTTNVARLYDVAKGIDPRRYVGITDCELLKPEAYPSLKCDYVSENRYYGWYYGTFDQFQPAIEGVHDMQKVTNVSEYGAGVNPYCHTWKAADISNKDHARHFEEWGNLYHEAHLTQIEAMPWLNFTSLWVMFDFAVASRREGYLNSSDGVNFVEDEQRMFTNDKGLVTRDRSLRKDAFYLYKSKWNQREETVYITSRRLTALPDGVDHEVKVYSNARQLSLYRDGELVETLQSSGEPTGVIWKFRPLRLQGAKEMTLRVVSDQGTEDSVTISRLEQ